MTQNTPPKTAKHRHMRGLKSLSLSLVFTLATGAAVAGITPASAEAADTFFASEATATYQKMDSHALVETFRQNMKTVNDHMKHAGKGLYSGAFWVGPEEVGKDLDAAVSHYHMIQVMMAASGASPAAQDYINRTVIQTGIDACEQAKSLWQQGDYENALQKLLDYRDNYYNPFVEITGKSPYPQFMQFNKKAPKASLAQVINTTLDSSGALMQVASRTTAAPRGTP